MKLFALLICYAFAGAVLLLTGIAYFGGMLEPVVAIICVLGILFSIGLIWIATKEMA